MAAYLGAHGPATIEAFGHWLSGGWFGKQQLRVWFEELGDRIAEVDVGGDPAYVLVEDLDELVSTRPTKEVRLLAGFDQYVMGPGTGDPHVVPPGRRNEVSKQSGWISPVAVAGGAVCGTWELNQDVARIRWFKEAGRPPRRALTAEVARLSAILDRDLHGSVGVG
jgi:hypothetical protein